ncbi:uncharacterized protein NECHADRAFT_34736, partial [Fusarium vanettenii 77-13-4]
ACLACQKRKSKCDGQRPSCCQCQKRGIQCVYQQRRFRGPGKRCKAISPLIEQD